MESPTGIIPEELMHPQDRERVIGFLIAQPLPATLKAELFEGYAATVGIKWRHSDLERLKRSGIDFEE